MTREEALEAVDDAIALCDEPDWLGTYYQIQHAMADLLREVSDEAEARGRLAGLREAERASQDAVVYYDTRAEAADSQDIERSYWRARAMGACEARGRIRSLMPTPERPAKGLKP